MPHDKNDAWNTIKDGKSRFYIVYTFLRFYFFFIMIDYIKGELTELQPAQAVVEAYGVGYALSISLNTYTAIQGKKDVKLFVYEAIVTWWTRRQCHALRLLHKAGT